jgi:hypothetical protein
MEPYQHESLLTHAEGRDQPIDDSPVVFLHVNLAKGTEIRIFFMATQYVPNILSHVSIYHKMYNYTPNILWDVKMNIITTT